MGHGIVVGSGDVWYKDGYAHAGAYELMDWSPGTGGLHEMSPSFVVLGGRIWGARRIIW